MNEVEIFFIHVIKRIEMIQIREKKKDKILVKVTIIVK